MDSELRLGLDETLGSREGVSGLCTGAGRESWVPAGRLGRASSQRAGGEGRNPAEQTFLSLLCCSILPETIPLLGSFLLPSLRKPQAQLPGNLVKTAIESPQHSNTPTGHAS